MKTMRRLAAVIMLAWGIGGAIQNAQATNIWTGTGNWNTPGNWSSNHVPLDGEDVLIDGKVVLTNSTASLASYTLAASAIQTNDGWGTVISAQVVTIYGTLTHQTNAATSTNELGQWIPNARVYIACSNFMLKTGGKIDAASKGYAGGVSGKSGYGPGFGGYNVGGISYGGGGGHGGVGGGYTAIYGQTNGPIDAPSGPGSGGGGYSATGGGAGGGAVRIEALDRVEIDGSILANAKNGSYADGGGAGGSVFIRCAILSGSNGLVSATGGNGAGPLSGGGGGGRIAVLYEPAAQSNAPVPGVQFTVAGGYETLNGDVGTLYFPDSQFLTRQTGPVTHSGQWLAPGLETRWEPNELTLSNAWLRFAAEGYVLKVANDFSIMGTDIRLHKLELSNAVVSCGGNLLLNKSALMLYRGETSGPTLNCGGDLTITNGAAFHVYAGMTDGVAPDYGARVSVTGCVTITSSAWIYPYAHATNGGSVLFRMHTLKVATANAGIDASSRGYAGGAPFTNGFGPGRGGHAVGGGAMYGCGGGYGGSGGASTTLFGQTNGLPDAPVGPGSGGGGGTTGSGGWGGGSIRIEAADAVEINGSLLANGGNGGYVAGGGSGGGIYIQCATLSGANGVLSATGGAGGGTSDGGGGGGRIAVLYDPVAQSNAPLPGVQFTTKSGLGTYNGDVGTLYFSDSQFLTRQTGPVTHSGQWLAPGIETRWEPNELTLSNAWLRFAAEGYRLNVTNGFSILGTDIRLHKLEMSNAVVSCGGNLLLNKSALMLYRGETSGPTLNCGGNLTVTNGAVFHVYAVSNDASPNYGAWVSVTGNVTVAPSSFIYPWSHPTNGGAVLFRMNNLTVAATAAIDASAKGYVGGLPGLHGFGPGRGAHDVGITYGSGGGYGGRGGGFTALYGQSYGDFAAPTEPGSGAGGGEGGAAGPGGVGGGALQIQAVDTVDVQGGLLANGGNGRGYSGGGSGGSIFVACRILAGANGVIAANGGTGADSWSGGGGGGRIAVLYDPAAQSNAPVPGIQFAAAPGKASGADGDMGSLYFRDSQLLTRQTGPIAHSGQWLAPGLETRWEPNELILSNAWLRFAAEGYVLNVTNGLSILGTDIRLHKLELSNAVVSCGGNLLLNKSALFLYRGETSGPVLNCGGDLTVTNGAAMHVYSGPTNGVAPDYGALVSVTGCVAIHGVSSWIYPWSHPTNGGSVLFRMNSLLIATNAGFDAVGKGYTGVAAGQIGYGPGRGAYGVSGLLYGSGGGHGGLGGGYTAVYGQTNGTAIAPIGPGSSGGGGVSGISGLGGGSVRLEVAGAAVIYGSVLADGTKGTGNVSGGGAGGGVFIQCGTLSTSTNALLSAKGGDAYNNSDGGGGGGRIAVWYKVPSADWGRVLAGDRRRVIITNAYENYTGRLTVTNGIGKANGVPGTIVFLTVKKEPGTLIIVR